MLERMTFCLNEHHASWVSIFVEKRWKNEDQDLLNHYNTILDKWTYYVSSERFKAMIDDFEFRAKNLNDCWIQLADLCAYPLINVVKNWDIHNPSYKIIEPKIYRNPKTKQQCWLKVIP
jgi:hypothetical protein